MSEQTRSRKVQEWSERLLRFSKSEQTVVQFCRSEGVSQPSFYAWRKKLKALESVTFTNHVASAEAFKPVSPIRFERVSLDPTDGSLFVFINRRRDRMKLLHFEAGGFWMYYRVLEAGTFETLAANATLPTPINFVWTLAIPTTRPTQRRDWAMPWKKPT